MKKAFLLLDFKTMINVVLQGKATTILTSMTGNKNFTDPDPALALLPAAISSFGDAMTLAKDGDRMKIKERQVQREALIAVLLQLMDYVTFIGKGDRVILMSSGFTVNAEVKTPRSFGKLKGFKVVQGQNSGELLASVDKVRGGDSYLFYYGALPIVNDSWKISPTGKITQCLISGLDRGKEYSVRVGVVGPKGKTIYSTVINIIVT